MSDSADLSAVEALLQERDALRGWLDRLERSETSVPETVRAKVRADYQSRLDGLMEQLRQHADVVATRMLEDQAEHDRLHDQARAAREALAEAELRHTVGEYDATRFEHERARFVADLEQYETALDAVALRIAGLEDVHLAVSREPTRQTAFPALELTVETDVYMLEDVAIEELAPEQGASDADDLLSIFDQAESQGAGASPESGESGAPQDPAPIEFRERPDPSSEVRTPGFGPLSFTPTGGVPDVSGPARPAVPSLTPPIGMPGLDQSPRFVRPAPERGSELVELPAERGEGFRVIPDPEPVLPEAPAGEAPEANTRTLRCGECGAMNRPLEWYCEKCGAELTAV